MIISHSRKFIFVRGYRNAGTSTKAALSTLCGDNDLISEYNPSEVDLIASHGLRGEQNNTNTDGKSIIPFIGHWTLAQAYNRFPETIGYDVVVMCRNPYDRMYSHARWLHQRARYRMGLCAHPATPDMVRRKVKFELDRSEDSKLAVVSGYRANHDARTTGNVTILRYEHLENDLQALFAQYGEAMPELMRLKSSNIVLPLSWQEVFTRTEINLVNRVFKSDFERYDYPML